MKTLNQISNQAYTLYYDSLDRGNRTRARLILRIKQKYNDNINNLPEQQKLLVYTHNWQRDKRNYEKRCNIKYPRSVYAGY